MEFLYPASAGARLGDLDRKALALNLRMSEASFGIEPQGSFVSPRPHILLNLKPRRRVTRRQN